MDKDNVQTSINIIERAQKNGAILRMIEWQKGALAGTPITSEHELLRCGTPACFAGLIAVSDEFQAQGGCVGDEGEPIYINNNFGSEAIELWLGISNYEAVALCYERNEMGRLLYKKDIHDVVYSDVLEALYLLLKTGSVFGDLNVK